MPASALAFTWCQVPIVYLLDDDADPSLTITREDGSQQTLSQPALSADDSVELFTRSGRIRQITVTLGSNMLLPE